MSDDVKDALETSDSLVEIARTIMMSYEEVSRYVGLKNAYGEPFFIDLKVESPKMQLERPKQNGDPEFWLVGGAPLGLNAPDGAVLIEALFNEMKSIDTEGMFTKAIQKRFLILAIEQYGNASDLALQPVDKALFDTACGRAKGLLDTIRAETPETPVSETPETSVSETTPAAASNVVSLKMARERLRGGGNGRE